jgi:hypothetical protein
MRERNLMIGRGWIAVVAALALASCTVAVNGGQKKASVAEGCVQSASQEIALFDATPDYLVEARSFEGPKPAAADFAVMAESNPCASATVVLTFRRKNDGALAHAYATSMNRMDLIEGHAGPAFDGARLREFLENWIKAKVSTTDTAADPSETLVTPLSATDYTALKAAKKRMVCYDASVHDIACFAVDADDVYNFQPFYTEDQS